MIDIHSHLLPGVDDGSPSIAVSVPVLERFASQGIECIVLTPHLVASRASSAPYERHLAILEELRAAAPSVPELRLGWEIMLDVPNADLRAAHLGLGGSRAILVEFPRTSVPARAAAELFRLRSAGSVPVLAHPERYWGCTVEKVNEWRSAGAVIQMDTAGLIGSGSIAAISRALLESGLVDLFASDNHGDSRSLAIARDWLVEVATPEHAELLTRTNARRLLDGEPLVPVPPLPRKSGIFGRLRELFFRPSTRS
jgi:protein-tyrosine phosphatase